VVKLDNENPEKMDRRTFLGITGKTAVLTALGLTFPYSMMQHNAEASMKFSKYPFTLGVASGDPLPDGGVLWD
jgi:alkaline phosphatase D